MLCPFTWAEPDSRTRLQRHGDRLLTLAGNRIEVSEFGGLKVSDAKIVMTTSGRGFGKGVVHFVGSVIYPYIPPTDPDSDSPSFASAEIPARCLSYQKLQKYLFTKICILHIFLLLINIVW
jgi:hypothetical protein